MPLAYSASLIAALKRRSGFGLVLLLDVQLNDGTIYYWTDHEGAYPAVIGAPATPNYAPKLKSSETFRFTRDASSDAGNITVENLSGNTVRRYLSGEFRSREFYHALAVLRLWEPMAQEALREFHAVIKEPAPGPEEMAIRLVQISDPSQYTGPWEITSEQCGVRYKGPWCGSASAEVDCPRTIAACTARGAREHYNGLPFPKPETAFAPTIG